MSTHTRFRVEGMHCASCSARIEKVVREMSGVNSANVNLAAETLDLDYEKSQVAVNEIIDEVDHLGFKLSEEMVNEPGKLKLSIIGMHCASCSSRIEKVVGNIEGVESATVNLAAETGQFVFDETKTGPRQIRQAIESLGFGSKRMGSELKEYEQRKGEKLAEIGQMRRRLQLEFLLVIPLLIISMGEMMGLPLPQWLAPHHSPLSYGLAQLVLTLPIMWLGRSFYLVGFPSLLRRSPNMDSLIAVGTGAAFLYSLWSLGEIWLGIDVAAKVMDLYFESVGVLITLVSLGKYLEAKSKNQTSEAISKLMELRPKQATLLKDGEQTTILVEDIEKEDILIIRPGESIPVDGVVIKGHSAVDESMMTGESIPLTKSEGDYLYGGTVNRSDALQMRATQTGENTMLARIIKMVRDAQGSKAEIARTADRVSYYFVPVVMIFALVTGIAWFVLGDAGFSQSLRFFVAVLVIACPCAMGLATPISIMVGTGRGAQLGVLVKNGETLETLEQVSTLVFDKTGTLTKGTPEVTDVEGDFSDPERQEVLGLLGSAELPSEHPLAEAVVSYVKKQGIPLNQPDGSTVHQGQGIVARVEGKEVLIGNSGLLEKENISSSSLTQKAQQFASEGKTPLYFAIDGRCRGVVGIADVIKEEAPRMIKRLYDSGREVIMLTGDIKVTAEAVAAKAGIDKVIAGVMPDNKAEVIKELKENGAKVAMIGDGINDAPALAVADVGIAMGTGIDVAIESADVVIMRGNLQGVVSALELSAAVMRNIRQNLFWAFGYNVLGIPVAAGLLHIFGGPTLSPMIAGGAMALSSVSVVSNALRLRYFQSLSK